MLRALLGTLLLTCSVCMAAPSAGACPSAEEIIERIGMLDLKRGTRTTDFETPPPTDLYRKASERPDEPYIQRDGDKGMGVILAQLPVEVLWKAINDEDHHDLEGDYFPVRHSEVISGTPRGASRLLFQYYKQAGIGRWWVTRVEMNRDLYQGSSGALWEIHWQDAMAAVDPDDPPMNLVSRKISPIKRSRGSWLLVPLTEDCTLVEFFIWSDPGGVIGIMQPLMAKKAVRETLRGVVRLAEEHLSQPHPGSSFVRADGTPLD